VEVACRQAYLTVRRFERFGAERAKWITALSTTPERVVCRTKALKGLVSNRAVDTHLNLRASTGLPCSVGARAIGVYVEDPAAHQDGEKCRG
jgi:hypothetical protein